MKSQLILRRGSFAGLTLFLLLLIACSEGSLPLDSEPSSPALGLATANPISATEVPAGQTSPNRVILLRNHGGDMEGHTPRGFPGMGAGLFAGDNLNPRFPEGDGVQLFLTFDLSAFPPGKVVSAMLRSDHASVNGTPFKDLGPLRAEEIRYSKFSPALWDLEALTGGDGCEFANSSDGPFQCDLAVAVQRSLDDSHPLVQFRLLLDRAGDNDGNQDLVSFFIANSNTNQPGIFELKVTIEQGN